MPPPVPPSVNAGRTIAGSPMVVERFRGRGVPGGLGRTLDDRARRVRLSDAVEKVAERLAVLGHPDGLERGPENADRVAVEDAGVRHRGREIERGLAAEPGQQAFGLLPGDDGLDGFDRERLEVDDVGDRGVGHDRGRVRVDEDRPHALAAQGTARLRPGVVELGRLADDDGSRTEDQDRRGLARLSADRAPSRRRRSSAGRHAARRRGRRTGRTRRARPADPARPRGGTGQSRSASRGGAAPRPSRR